MNNSPVFITDLDLKTFSFTWIIKNFNIVLEDTNHPISSSYFEMDETSSTEGKIRWKLELITKSVKNQDIQSITLKLDDSYFSRYNNLPPRADFRYATKVRYSLVNCTETNETSLGSFFAIFDKKNCEKSTDFCIRHYREYIYDNTINIRCEIELSGREIHKIIVNNKDATEKLITERLSLNFSSLLQSGDFSDFTIKTSKMEFKTHKNILAARSPVFHKMLTTMMYENLEGKIDIPDFDADTVKIMLDYMYSGTVPNIDSKNAVELYKISHKYELEDLMVICGKFIVSTLNISNVFEIFELSTLYENEFVQKAALEFIKTNMKEWMMSEIFKEMKEIKPQTIVEIFYKINITN